MPPEYKRCRTCQLLLVVDDFRTDGRGTSGRFADCLDCTGERNDPWKLCSKCGEWKQLFEYAKNVASRDGKRPNCRECWTPQVKTWTDSQPKGYNRDKVLRVQYGLTQENWEALFQGQGGVCAICERVPESRLRFCVDHDHACCPGIKSCGKCIRGLLCHSCNVSIGHFQDNAEMLRRAADYVEFHRIVSEVQLDLVAG